MTLSDHERQAWEELERKLMSDLPEDTTTAHGPHTAGTLLPSPRRTLVLLLIMAFGTSLLLTGVLTYLLPMAITGLIIVCVAAHLLHRPRADTR